MTLALIGLVAWIVSTLRKDRRQGKSTCGGSCGGAEGRLQSLAKDLGLEFRGLAEIPMPENYIAMFRAPEQEEALQIVDRAEEKIDQIAIAIREGVFLEELGGGRLQSAILNSLFKKFIIADKRFLTNDNCTSCGQCVRVCPTENIYLDGPEGAERHPVWSGRCIHCMACINRCPFRAIEYGSATEKRERYRCPKTL